MADGTLFERRGIPAAAICTHTFKKSGDAMAKIQGYPGYRFALTPHPLSSLTPEELKTRAEEVLPQVLDLLGVKEVR